MYDIIMYGDIVLCFMDYDYLFVYECYYKN